ncbi:hypothetical protein [Hydrogenophaga sp.]|uniref:hypothetical protein n=1 Tax=Hydrogenophaga sp. TaxID=1904254 RepID=UPI0026038930|nr:hypothetical protein [Hydrogenophaga sp.]MDM7949013.1 hypothetical protein [Hydrogenophaga sp.]
MNTLDFEPLDPDEFGFRGFRLLIDGQYIYSVPGCTFGELSYWEFADDLGLEDESVSSQKIHRVVGVCDCGFAGCGATWARVEKHDGIVTFSEFSGFQNPQESPTLTFDRENYEAVIARMRILTAKYQQLDARSKGEAE